MSRRLRRDDQLRLLEELTDLGSGQAESEAKEAFVRRFHPVAEHLHAFDPDVVLIVGERGTGKSALFKAVFQHDLIAALARHSLGMREFTYQRSPTSWVEGYPRGSDFPDPRSLRRFVAEGGESPERAHDLWFAYLVRALSGELDAEAKEGLACFLDLPGGAPGRVLEALETAGDGPIVALDALDRRLQQEDRWIFVGYDELDTLGGFHWSTMVQASRGLIAFWAGYSRRWQRLRAKIFLRTDLFRRHVGIGGADLAKLAANRAELTWSDRNLLAMLIKRIANTSDELLSYCRNARAGVRLKEEDLELGWIPVLKRAEDARPLVERMVGPYMGPNPKKGRTFRWILDHLRDGRRHAAPRALVRLLEGSAARERDQQRASPPKLLHPTSLRQALEDVSAFHVAQAIDNEWPWLHGVKERIQRTPLVPWDRRSLEGLLQENWDGSWAQADPTIRPPAAQDPRELVEYLLELGVFRERRDGRIDVPDIYLFGLGLRRKGGVRRK